MIKKTLLTTLLILGCLLGAGELRAQEQEGESLPYSYDFEFTDTYNETNAKAALTAAGWTLTNASNYSYIRRYMYNNTYSFEFLVDESKDYQYLVSPLLSNSSILNIVFYWKTTSSTTVKYKIGYSKSDTPVVTGDEENFTWSDEVTCTWQQNYTLASQVFSTDGIKYIAIMFDRNGETNANRYLVIDDITISQYVTPPTNLSVSAYVTSATCTWNAGSDETNWLLYYSNSNSTPSASLVTPSDNVKTVSSNPKYSLTGLTEGTTYYAWVRSGDGNGNFSSWVGPVEFTPATVKTAVINDGTKTNSSMPFYYTVDPNLNRSQFIMPASELTDMAGMKITKLTFHTSTVSATWGNATFKIYMKEVENSSFVSNAYYNWSEMTEVFDASSTFSLNSKKLEIVLTTPYVYYGGNLMIGFYQETTGTSPSYLSWYGVNDSDTSKKLSLYGNGTNNPSSSYFLPKTTFTYTYLEIFNSDGNWPTSDAPAATDNVLVKGNINITDGTNATAQNIDIDAGSLTIANGATLTCNNINTAGGSVTIQDGGQLITNNAVQATLQKSIEGWEVTQTQGGYYTDGWYFIASPVNNYATENIIITDYSNTDLFSYDEEHNYWFHADGSANPFTTLTRGQGYLYANSTGDDLSFIGEVPATNSNIEIDLSFVGSGKTKGCNLLGNPFTCNLTTSNVKLFNGTTNTVISSYYTVENGTELSQMTLIGNPIKPGRGFLIQASAANQKLVFNPDSKSEEATAKPSFITIEAGNDQFMDRACIQFGNGNTLRKMSINDQVSHVYVINDGKDYAAATITEMQGQIPVNFVVAKNGQYTIKVKTDNLETSYLHLIDNLTGANVDLLQTPSYTFQGRTSDIAARFRLLFTTTGVDENDDNSVSQKDFAFISDGQLIVNGNGTLYVYDALGRQISVEQLSTVNCLSTANYPTGLYLLQLVDGNSVRTQKIIVK